MDERKITTSSTQIPGANAPVANVQDTRRTAGDNDRVRRLQVHPVLGREVVERQQLLLVAGDLGDGFRVLGLVSSVEVPDGLLGVRAVFGVADLGEGLAGRGLGRFRQAVENVDYFVLPAAALAGLGEHLAQRRPEPQRPVADREHRSPHAAAAGIAQQARPGLGRLAVPVSEGDQLLLPVGADPDHH